MTVRPSGIGEPVELEAIASKGMGPDVKFVFEPDPDGGYHAYAPELPGLHAQGDDLDEATANAEEALALYVEGLPEEGRPLMGVVRRRLKLPA